MPIRHGNDYLEGIRDDREVWIGGERVSDIAAHPELGGFANTLAEMYDLQHDPEVQDLYTIKSPDSGELVSRGYSTPTSVEELVTRRQMIEDLMRRTGATTGRLPEYMASIMVGLYDVRSILAEENPAYAANVEAYFEYCRENDLSLTHSFADAPRNARFNREDFDNLKVVEERSDGIVVSGVKSVATLAPYADEYLSLAPNRPGLASEEIAYFGIPVSTPGLRMHCRPSLATKPSPDRPLSSRFEEMDSWVVFDDVFVPRDRVFYLQRKEVHLGLLNQILPWAFHHILTRMVVKAEVIAGICAAVVDYLGKGKDAVTQLSLAEVYCYAETLRAFLESAEQHAVESVSGLVMPDPKRITLGRIHAVEHQPRILQIMRELCGSGILMAPGVEDLEHAIVGADAMKYLIGPDDLAADRFRMLKLAWEYGCESFGSRQLLFEMHNAGSHLSTKQRMAATYDNAPFVDMAKRLAGIQE